jgi:hypothetical protein
MQEEKFVLPKFTVPGQRRWIPFAIAGAGGLVVISIIMLAVVVSRGRVPVAPVAAVPVNAEPAPLAASATPVPVAPKPTLAAAATSAPDIAKEEAPVKAARAASHRPRRAHAKSLAKAGAPSRGHAAKGDALDDLLKRFK